MKKVLAFVLVALLVMGLAVTAAANDRLSAGLEDSLPALANKQDNVRLHHRDDISNLPDEKQQTMEESEKALKKVDSEGLSLRYLFYTEILSGENTVALEFAELPADSILFMQYVNGAWVTLEHSVGDGGVITVPVTADAPFAIFMDSIASPGASNVKLIPVLTDESYLLVWLHSLEEAAVMPEEIQNRMAEAKENLKNACPEGFAVKYFFELEIIGTEAAVDVDFEPIEHTEIVFKQYVDGAWTELEFSIDNDGIITVSALVEGPVAVFTK